VSSSLAARYTEVRQRTLALAGPLSAEDCGAQSMPEASPVKWHLAHTTWFFETFVLPKAVPGHRPPDRAYRELFNSYYQSVGAQHPRPQRGLLTRPSLDEVRAYRSRVDDALLSWLEDGADPELLAVVELGLHHEQQHQELILTDLKHLFGCNPLRPAYRAQVLARGEPSALRWQSHPEGVFEIGHGGPGFAFDNESPRHRVFVEAFELASRPVSCGEYLEFMADGGYGRSELWLSEGWRAVFERGWQAPLYWERSGELWLQHTLAGLREVDPAEPVCHVSHFEADAFARWAGARLPDEAEWELVAADAGQDGNLAESGRLHPAAAPPRGAEATPGAGPQQLFGDVWEWTRSSYGPYPGFRPLAGGLGEYNGKFMSGQLVLRGGSCATPRSHIRASYRNFFYPSDRWQFSGLRLARDARQRA
jgi:ergothioneine biosynthesis protein EgtB